VTASGAQPLLVDTDVVSYLFRHDSRAESYRPHLQGRLLIISFMTFAELELWAVAHNWGPARRQEMEEHLRGFTVLHSSPDLCSWWAMARDEARRRGRPIQASDAWLAAAALLYKMPLLTNNPHDFVGVSGVTIVTTVQPGGPLG